MYNLNSSIKPKDTAMSANNDFYTAVVAAIGDLKKRVATLEGTESAEEDQLSQLLAQLQPSDSPSVSTPPAA
jgi:seryl-tRNA synthetase